MITALFGVALPHVPTACSVCFGQSDSPVAHATNMGIFLMLGVVGAVLAGFAAFIVYLNRRARLVSGDGYRAAEGAVGVPAHARSILSGRGPQQENAEC